MLRQYVAETRQTSYSELIVVQDHYLCLTGVEALSCNLGMLISSRTCFLVDISAPCG